MGLNQNRKKALRVPPTKRKHAQFYPEQITLLTRKREISVNVKSKRLAVSNANEKRDIMSVQGNES